MESKNVVRKARKLYNDESYRDKGVMTMTFSECVENQIGMEQIGDKCDSGFSYEDLLLAKKHFEKIKENFNLNCSSKKINIINKAISTKKGQLEFIRINDNSTGSHLSGAKEKYYGEVEKTIVDTDAFKEIISNFDFIKIDVEGHEAEIILSTTFEDWDQTEAMVEVGSIKNSKLIYNFFRKSQVNIFAQKIGWKMVNSLDDMPLSYKDGSLFISKQKSVPW